MFLLVGWAATLAAAPGKDHFPVLSPGVAVHGTLSVSGERFATYTFRVPPGAALAEIRLRGSPTDMDLYLKHGGPMGNWGTDAEISKNSGEADETVQLLADGTPELNVGVYYVDVALAASEPVAHGERWLREIPYTLEFDLVEAPEAVTVAPGAPLQAAFRPGDGLYHCYRVDIPAGTAAARIDVESRRDDLDLYYRAGSDFVPRRDAQHIATSRRSREGVILDARTDPPLSPGTYFVHVYRTTRAAHDMPYAIEFTLGAEPPARYLEIPPLPTDRTGLARTIPATVEILGAASAGAGILIDPRGWLLTAQHVIDDPMQGDTPWVVSVTLDETQPPVEMFLARVVEQDPDGDVALLRIVSGLYGQPLPEGYLFPCLSATCRDRLPIGSVLRAIGYPTIGGMGSREPVSVAEGILSGFDRVGDSILWKTDMTIGHGNSGGPVIDAQDRLVGIATSMLSDPGGDPTTYGYFFPMESLSEAWLRHLSE